MGSRRARRRVVVARTREMRKSKIKNVASGSRERSGTHLRGSACRSAPGRRCCTTASVAGTRAAKKKGGNEKREASARAIGRPRGGAIIKLKKPEPLRGSNLSLRGGRTRTRRVARSVMVLYSRTCVARGAAGSVSATSRTAGEERDGAATATTRPRDAHRVDERRERAIERLRGRRRRGLVRRRGHSAASVPRQGRGELIATIERRRHARVRSPRATLSPPARERM